MATFLQTSCPDISVLIDNSHYFSRKAHVENQCIYRLATVIHTIKEHCADETLIVLTHPMAMLLFAFA
ncbi:hypothetical protein, partial [Salmonella sp. s30631]|uniref:hypothetical protein n=1 Tax=Salmonella sp. s30631 TaxID=3159637 RepID=UPI00397FBFA9